VIRLKLISSKVNSSLTERNRRAIRTILLAFIFLAWGTWPAIAQVKKVILEIEGLESSPLTARLERNLNAINGVAQVRVLPDEDRVELEVKPNQKFVLEDVESAVKDAGVFLQRWELTATGELVNWNGKPALWIPGNQVKLVIDSSSQETELKIRKLLQTQGQHPKITVEGTMQKVTDTDRGGRVLKLWVEKMK
jgi:hypothetical protein